MERMKEAYGMLYAIENGLRRYIDDEMTSHYGPDWQFKAPKNMSFRSRPLNQSYFYDLVSYLRVYPCFKNSDDLILTLRKLYSIRNKIAHCHELTEEEYDMLNEAYELIMDVVCSKVR